MKFANSGTDPFTPDSYANMIPREVIYEFRKACEQGYATRACFLDPAWFAVRTDLWFSSLWLTKCALKHFKRDFAWVGVLLRFGDSFSRRRFGLQPAPNRHNHSLTPGPISGVRLNPLITNCFKSSGIDVISLLFLSVLSWPRIRLFSQAQALIKCTA